MLWRVSWALAQISCILSVDLRFCDVRSTYDGWLPINRYGTSRDPRPSTVDARDLDGYTPAVMASAFSERNETARWNVGGVNVFTRSNRIISLKCVGFAVARWTSQALRRVRTIRLGSSQPASAASRSLRKDVHCVSKKTSPFSYLSQLSQMLSNLSNSRQKHTPRIATNTVAQPTAPRFICSYSTL